MDKAKRAQTAETPKQPSLGLKLRAPYLYPDRAYSAISTNRKCQWHVRFASDRGGLGSESGLSERAFLGSISDRRRPATLKQTGCLAERRSPGWLRRRQ
jgi:hypothetical protein